MDYKAAIAKLSALEVEGIADLVSAVTGKIGDLEQKNYDLIGEKRNVSQRNQAMESALNAIAKELKIDGDLEVVLDQVEPRIREIAKSEELLRESKTSLESQLSQANSKVLTFERQSKISQVASAAKANPAVLERLLGDRLDDLKITEDGDVTLGDQPLQEAIAADASLAPFAVALFPQADKQDKPRLPGGSPNGEAPKSDPIAGYLARAYRGHQVIARTSG